MHYVLNGLRALFVLCWLLKSREVTDASGFHRRIGTNLCY